MSAKKILIDKGNLNGYNYEIIGVTLEHYGHIFEQNICAYIVIPEDNPLYNTNTLNDYDILEQKYHFMKKIGIALSYSKNNIIGWVYYDDTGSKQKILNDIKKVIQIINTFEYDEDLENEAVERKKEFEEYEADLFNSFNDMNESKNNFMKKTIKLNEQQLTKVIKESVRQVLKEEISTDYRNALKQVLNKSFSNLNDNEKIFLYDVLNEETWEVVYAALNILKPY
jgi:hypothetical protein